MQQVPTESHEHTTVSKTTQWLGPANVKLFFTFMLFLWGNIEHKVGTILNQTEKKSFLNLTENDSGWKTPISAVWERKHDENKKLHS